MPRCCLSLLLPPFLRKNSTLLQSIHFCTPIWSLRDFVVSERFQPVSCDLATLYLVYNSTEKHVEVFEQVSANVEAFEQCSLKGFFLICICHQIYFFRRIANVGENCPCKILPCKLANCPTTTPFFNLWGGVTPHTSPNSYAPASNYYDCSHIEHRF